MRSLQFLGYLAWAACGKAEVLRRWRAFQGAELLLHGRGKIDENEIAPVIQEVLTTFIDDTDKVILGGLQIG